MKTLQYKKLHNHFIIIVILCLIGFLCASYYLLKHHYTKLIPQQNVHNIHIQDKVIALTYDDGPNPPFTNEILSILKRQAIHATFFVVGKYALEHADLVRKIYSEGHEIGNHTWSHQRLTYKTPFFIYHQIKKTDNLLQQLGYKKDEIAFRSPYAFKGCMLTYVLFLLNKDNILFSVDPRDWELPGSQAIVDHVLSEVKPGSIILLHDGGRDRTQTVQASEVIITELKKQGYRFVTIAELLSLKQPQST